MPRYQCASSAVAERAGLGVLADQVEHLADVAEVALRIEPLIRRVLAAVAQRPVVVGTIGQHRDAVRVEVGVDDEHVVLEAAAALGEADPVLEQQAAPEQLVRREQAEQPRPVEGDGVQALPEHLARHPLAVADDLADDDVGLVGERGRVQALDRVGLEPVVVVDEVDVLPAGHVDADVAGAARPARVGHVADADVGMLRGERVEPGGRRVGRAVVDEDQLELARRHRLPEQRGDALVDVAPRVVDGHDDADGGR